MKLELPDVFITGHADIDAQHLVIVDAVNAISAVLNAGAYDRCPALFDDFLDIFRGHFQSEEKLFAAFDYPGLADHADFHKELLLQAEAIKALCAKPSPPNRVRRCFDELTALLVEDVIRGDMSFATFLIQQDVMDPPSVRLTQTLS